VGVLADAAHKTGRAKADFEIREISSEEYERIKSLTTALVRPRVDPPSPVARLS
jgi:hypothetical protein